MNIFQKAGAGLPLTPAQRAFLKLLQSFVLTAVVAGLLTAAQYLAGDGPIDMQKLYIAVGGAAALAFAHAVTKYFTAQSDTQPLGNAIELVVDAIEERFDKKYGTQPLAPADAPKAPEPGQGSI